MLSWTGSAEARATGGAEMYFLLGILALIGFMVGLVVHVSTWFSWGWTMGEVWYLHLLAMGFFFAAFLKCRVETGTNEIPMDRAPYPAQVLLTFTFIYALLNFVLFAFTVGDGKVREKQGRYFMVKGGQEVTVSAEDYRAHERVVLRGFSGHWQLFFLASALMLLMPPERIGDGASDDRDRRDFSD
jgi:hypothetical protein